MQFCGALFGLGLQRLIDPTSFEVDDMNRRFSERLEEMLCP